MLQASESASETTPCPLGPSPRLILRLLQPSLPPFPCCAAMASNAEQPLVSELAQLEVDNAAEARVGRLSLKPGSSEAELWGNIYWTFWISFE